MESSSSPPLPREHSIGLAASTEDDDERRLDNRRRRPRPPPSRRSRPPSQDRLVVVFVTAAAAFTLIAMSPFFFGDFSSYSSSRMIGHREGMLGGAGNKTLLTWHRLAGLRRRRKEWEESALEKNDGTDGGGRVESVPEGGRNRSNSSSISVEDIRGRTHVYASIMNDRRRQDSPRLDRGVSGLPSSMTPALIGARHGSISCHEDGGDGRNMDELAYWNDPQGESDVSFVSPFDPRSSRSDDVDDHHRRYVTFEPDRGGWNNIRMSLEIVMVFAAATGRTLVLPPDTPFYLLSKDGSGAKSGKKRHHGFADFIDLDNAALGKKLTMITMTEFLVREGGGDTAGMFELPEGAEGTKILNSAEQCYYIAKSDRPCDSVYEFLRSNAHVPNIQGGRNCLIFDSDQDGGGGGYDNLPDSTRRRVDDFCNGRNPVFFGKELASARLVHFHAGEKQHRLLNHFYAFLFFTDVRVDHYYKRFVRDFFHYPDAIFCAAGRVIRSLEEESVKLSSSSSEKPSYSSMHVRRGDFQYKKVRITAQDLYVNTRELFSDNELIYIATDEKSKEFFEPLAKHYNLRFLSDFTESAGLNELDPNLMGMIDSIVASRGRLFVGTWFSTFTGYINRIRGYYGMPGYTSYYSTPDRKYNTHKWDNPHKMMHTREWPTAWIGIDGDEAVSEERIL